MKRLIAVLVSCLIALPALAEIEIKEVTSPSGIKAWLVEDHSIPFTALELRFRGGTSLDEPDKRGAVYLMSGLIEEGAGDMDARTYARELESLAASFQYNATDDTVSISAQFLTENRDEVIDLLHTTIHEPRFDPDAVERVRAQVLSGLKSDQTDPNDIAGLNFAKMAYGDHPYGTEGKGSIESVSVLTREDVIAAYEGVFARDRLYVGAVGDITAEELGALLDNLLADLPAEGKPIPAKAEVTIAGGVSVVDFDTPQSVALFGQKGIDRDDPDFFPAFILNHILGGGGFESRLMQEVREKRGLTYGIATYLVPKDLASVYLGSVSSANDRIAEAVDVIRAEWARAAAEGVTQKELEDAKTYLTGAYPLRFDGNGQIAGIMVGMQMEDLPIDYISTRNDKVNAVTLEDVNRVASELLDPDGLHFTIVGKPEGLDG
ncbi:M16 family metallopeptidase [Ruegeria arenilitoris]|uniref:M16 family metallopeptidase n=1 Tax=Ruegeria arenilitoris TaxID=1173585 RepID=UPI0014801842|nr:pitrilysin family protein [Ruegeria arenilitoris]